MGAVAIITARGGSKRIPHKNIKNFLGKPIISYSIEAALASGIFDEVIVSTDSREIADIAKQYGATVPFMRSEKNSDDNATTSEVLCEVLKKLAAIGKDYEFFCCLYPTAPFVTAERLIKAMQLLVKNGKDSVVPVVAFAFPPQRAVTVRNGRVAYLDVSNANTRSQDLETLYHDCGQFYFCRTDAFMRYQTLMMPETEAIIIPEEEAQDIDNPSDWVIAELKYKVFKGRDSGIGV